MCCCVEDEGLWPSASPFGCKARIYLAGDSRGFLAGSSSLVVPSPKRHNSVTCTVNLGIVWQVSTFNGAVSSCRRNTSWFNGPGPGRPSYRANQPSGCAVHCQKGSARGGQFTPST